MTVSNDVGSVTSIAVSPVFRPLVAAPVLVSGVMQFQLTVPDGRAARVQSSPDLIHWTDFLPAPVSGGTVIVEDRQVAADAAKFFRILLE